MVPNAASSTGLTAHPFRTAALLLLLSLCLDAGVTGTAAKALAATQASQAEQTVQTAPEQTAQGEPEQVEQKSPEQTGQAEPEQAGPEQAEPGEPEQAEQPERQAPEQTGQAAQGEQTGPEQAEKDNGEQAAKPKPPPTIRLFGTVEFRSLISNLPKWERVLASEKSRPTFKESGLDVANPQVVERWAKLKEKLKDEPLKEQAQRVNNFFNQWPYKIDLDLWGLEDYWATPREFMDKSGDCEDYAIAKYYALRDLGVAASKLRVAAIKDTIRNLGHAVLIVYMENDAYVLDNLTNLVLSHKKLTHYAPQYSTNEEFWWRHVKPKQAAKK